MARVVVYHDPPKDPKYVICSGPGGCGCPVLDTPEDKTRHSRNIHGLLSSVTDVPLPDRDVWSSR